MKREKGKNGRYVCPCCGYATLENPSQYGICEICYWEDDGQDDPNSKSCRDSPNHVSLAEGRLNFLRIGASDPNDINFVRQPRVDDERVRNYRLKDGKVVKG